LAADLTKCGEEFTVAMTRLEQVAVQMAGHFGEHHGFAS
jgi:hypothetical protein